VFRILSIDGGGIKGAFAAAFLSGLQQSLDHSIANYFDLICGTSTGGIIAIALGLGLAPDQILEFYKSNGAAIFPESQAWLSRARYYFFTKYDADPLFRALRLAYGDRVLGDSKSRLLIPSFSALTGRIYVYKTPHHERFQTDWRLPAVEVAMATAAAPTYFPPYVSPSFITHLDGGMWANNPTGYAVVEAVGVLNAHRGQIRVLSVGCTSAAQTFALKGAGKWGWRRKALEAAFCGQSFGSMGVAAVLIGHEGIQRVDPIVPEGYFSIDSTSRLSQLEALGREHARTELPRFRALFGGAPADVFKPLYGPLSEG
jgi:uncharacterized protein